MTPIFALHYIPVRMNELGIKAYFTKYRDMYLFAGQSITIDAYGEYFYLLNDYSDLVISSEFGEYDPTALSLNEFQHEHQGKITITNNSGGFMHVLFIQVIPKNQ